MQTQTHNHHTRKPTTDSIAILIASADCSAIAEDLWVEREPLIETERERVEQREEWGKREKEKKKKKEEKKIEEKGERRPNKKWKKKIYTSCYSNLYFYRLL